MRLQAFEQALVDGGRGELEKFGSCRYCVVVDWQDSPEQIIEAVNRQLPEGYLQFRRIDERACEVVKQGVTHRMDAPQGIQTELILQSINRVLLPDYEMRMLMPEASDTSSLLLRPASWWNDFAATYPARLRMLFVTIDERIRQVGIGTPQKKSWWEKLIGS